MDFKRRFWNHQHSLSPNLEIQFNLSWREKMNHFQKSWNQCAAFTVVKWESFLINTVCSVWNFPTWFGYLTIAWVVFNSSLFQSQTKSIATRDNFPEGQVYSSSFKKVAPHRKGLCHINSHYSSDLLPHYCFHLLCVHACAHAHASMCVDTKVKIFSLSII